MLPIPEDWAYGSTVMFFLISDSRFLERLLVLFFNDHLEGEHTV